MFEDFSLTTYSLLGLNLIIIIGIISRRYQRGPSRTYTVDLTGQVVVITGCSAGIGKENARELAKRNATIVFACRDEQKTMKIINQIKQETGNQNLFFIRLDLQDQNSIREFSVTLHKKFQKLNILINNAGVGFPVTKRDVNGHDINFKTNHMGHFLLTNLLMDLIISTKQSRIINVSSSAHTFIKESVNFDDAWNGKIDKVFMSYATTKYANILFTNQLQKKFQDKNIDSKVVSLHPGVVSTDLWQTATSSKILRKLLYPVVKFLYSFALTEVEGSWTTNFTALQPYAQLQPSGYYQKNNLSNYTKFVSDLDQAQELWDFSVKELKIKTIF